MAANPRSIELSILLASECPVCGCASLTAREPANDPDAFVCESCGAHFSISTDGKHLQMVTAPPGLPGFLEERPEVPEAPQIEIQRLIRPDPERVAVRISEKHEPIETAELVSRARKLYSLGNSNQRVRKILEGIPGVQPGQVNEALAGINVHEQERRSTLFWIGIALVGILVVLIGMVVVLGASRQNRAAQTGEGNALPEPLQRMIGSGSELLNLPAVKVHQESATGKRSACPTQPANAARLFGGEEGMWSITLYGWTMFNIKPQTIRIPEGMSADYPILRENPEWVNVSGPAVLDNVLYLNLTCQKTK